ncbi:MAG: DUF1987 domain-containing protein [Bacteroides sp.]|nr:DUF1987 domain-containing protein [Bacteroides sp.]
MEKLTLAPTLNTPGVNLDPVGNKFELKGESRPENVRNFYLPILDWLEKFAGELPASDGSTPLNFSFNFEYFNSTSAKYILDIFKILNSINSSGKAVNVSWHYEEDDEDMYEVGMEMSRMAGIDFEYVKVDL